MVKYTLCLTRPQPPGRAEPFYVWKLPDGTAWAEFRRAPSGYHLRFPDLAEFEISADGGHVQGFPAPEIAPARPLIIYTSTKFSLLR